jgi:hypothetical protein
MYSPARARPAEFDSKGYNVPLMTIPYPVLWLLGRFDPTIRLILPGLGGTVLSVHVRGSLGNADGGVSDINVENEMVHDAAVNILGINFKDPKVIWQAAPFAYGLLKATVLETAYSLIKNGVVPDYLPKA